MRLLGVPTGCLDQGQFLRPGRTPERDRFNVLHGASELAWGHPDMPVSGRYDAKLLSGRYDAKLLSGPGRRADRRGTASGVFSRR